MSDLFWSNRNWDLWRCYKCAVEIMVPSGWNTARRNDVGQMFCINGHPQVYCESTADKLRRERDTLKQQMARIEEEKRDAEKRAAAAEAATNRLRKRVAAGICPCCHRSVRQLAQHMKTKHPDFGPLPLKAVS
jgi:hypothetical protein